MAVRDLKNRIIVQGDLVSYTGTLTRGEVDQISTINGVSWVRIKSTGLLYRADYVEVVEKDGKESGSSGNHGNKKLEKSKQKDEVRNIKKERSIQEKIKHSSKIKKSTATEISDHSDGPGYGGG